MAFCLWQAENLVSPGPLSILFFHGCLLAASALVASNYLTRAHKVWQMLGREKTRLLFMEESAGREMRRKLLKGSTTENFPFIYNMPNREMLLYLGG